MAGCSFLVLEGVDGVRGKALRCSPSAGRRRGRRCAVPRADRGKGAALFSAHWALWFYSRKTSHREVFLDCANRKFARGLFSYKGYAQAREVAQSVT